MVMEGVRREEAEGMRFRFPDQKRGLKGFRREGRDIRGGPVCRRLKSCLLRAHNLKKYVDLRTFRMVLKWMVTLSHWFAMITVAISTYKCHYSVLSVVR